jgi:hypothetical protein
MAEQSNRIQFLKDALKKLATAVREVSKGLIDLDKIVSRITGSTRDLGKEMNTASKGVNQMNKQLQENEQRTKKADKASKGFFGNIGKNLKTIVSFYGAYQVLNLALRAFRELTIGSAKKAIEFEKALADLAAVAGLTTKEVDRLKNVVFDVAGVTSLTAIEVVALQKELAKLGTSVSDIENLTRPIALLSQALGEDPGGVAATLKKTLNMFQATSGEADRFANVLVGAVNESALTLQDLGTALGYVGPLGRQLGVSFEETAALLGILADNGFKANKAGTGLRQFFITAAKDGRPFNEFLEDIANRNLDVTEAVQLFNKTGASQALILGENIEKFKQLSEELNKADRLFMANAKQMATTQGQLDLLASAYDKFLINAGDVYTRTELFLELLERLDPASAGQARAFKFISSASDKGAESLDNLTTSLINFNTTQEEQEAGSKALFQILREGSDLTDKQLLQLEKRFNALKKEEPELRLSDFLQRRVNESVRDAGLFLEGVIDLSAERAKSLRAQRIEELATNDQYEAAVELTQELTESAKEGVMTYEEQTRVTKGLESELTRLQETRENQKELDIEEITVLEKRIALYEELLTSVKNLENSQEAINERRKKADKEAQDRFKTELADLLIRIKETEEAIDGLTVEGAEEALFGSDKAIGQIDLLDAFFGGAEDIIAEATKRFGADSEIVKELTKTLKKTAESISVSLPKEVGETIELPIKVAFIPEKDIELPTPQPPDVDITTFLDKAKEAFKDFDWGDVIVDSVKTATDAIDAFNETALENTRNRLDSEKDAIAQRYSVEQDILKSQLDNQLITESQFRTKQLELRRAQIAKENSIDKKIFDSEKKKDKQDAGIDYLVALASIIPNLIIEDKEANPLALQIKSAITAGLATVAFGAEIAAINQRKFFPKQFAEGGMVNGPSHDQGGVPFSVQGTAGYEMEGGEFIVNKRATSMHRDLLERINDSHKVRPLAGAYKFAQGGLVTAQANESVDYLKAIAEATTSTAIQTSKPVRAFVSSKDLRSNETERRLRDRNDRI